MNKFKKYITKLLRTNIYLISILIATLLILNTINLILKKIDYAQVTYDIIHYPIFMYNFRLNMIISNIVLLIFIAFIFFILIKYKKPNTLIIQIIIIIASSILYLYFFRISNFHSFRLERKILHYIRLLVPFLVIVLTILINHYYKLKKEINNTIIIVASVVLLLTFSSFRIYDQNLKINRELNKRYPSEIGSLNLESGYYNIEFDRVLDIFIEYNYFPTERLSHIKKEEIEAKLNTTYKFDILKFTERFPLLKIKSSEDLSKIKNHYTFYGDYLIREYDNEIFIYNKYEKNNTELENLRINIINILEENISFEIID